MICISVVVASSESSANAVTVSSTHTLTESCVVFNATQYRE